MTITYTSKFNLPQWSAGTDSPSRTQFNAFLAYLEAHAAWDQQGPLANRPAASISGRFWFATDNNVLYRDNGTAWTVVGSITRDGWVSNSAVTTVANTIAALANTTVDIEDVTIGAVNVRKTGSDGTATFTAFDMLGFVAAGGPSASLLAQSKRPGAASRVAVARADANFGGTNIADWVDNRTGTNALLMSLGMNGALSVLGSIAAGTSLTAATATIGDDLHVGGDVNVSGNAAVTGAVTAASFTGHGALPVGSVVMYTNATAPDGWLVCNGASVLRTAYPALYAVIGTRFGSADSTHFTLPNMLSNFPVGANPVIGATGGAAQHNHDLGPHTHDVGSNGAAAQIAISTTGQSVYARLVDAINYTVNRSGYGLQGQSAGEATVGAALAGRTDDDNAGSTANSSSYPPYVAFNFIIRAV